MSKPTNFIDKEFVEVEGGHYDEYGFYHSPNGSKFIFFSKKK